MTTTIDSAGRIVIPKQIRDEMGLAGGDHLEIRSAGGKIEIEPKEEDTELVVNDLGFTVLRTKGGRGKTITSEQVRNAIREMREERSRR